MRLAVDDEGRAGLRAHRSHDVLAVADCPLAPPGALDTVLGRRFPAGEVDVVVDAGGAVHTTCTSGDGAGEDHARGPVPVRAAGREWRLSPGVFWQVHPALPDVLAQVVGEWAAAPRGGTAWDLYGGVGLFAAVLAEQVGPDGSVTVVESARAAVDDGRAALADLPQVGWRVGRVEKVLTGLPGAPDVVVADPPRKGLGRAVVDALAAHGPAQVVYVACDPAALARDVAVLRGPRLHARPPARVRRLPDDPPHGVRGPAEPSHLAHPLGQAREQRRHRHLVDQARARRHQPRRPTPQRADPQPQVQARARAARREHERPADPDRCPRRGARASTGARAHAVGRAPRPRTSRRGRPSPG